MATRLSELSKEERMAWLDKREDFINERWPTLSADEKLFIIDCME